MRATRRTLRLRGALAVAGLLIVSCSSSSNGPEAAAGATVESAPPSRPACQAAPLEDRAATVLLVGIGEGTTIDDPVAAEVASLGVGGVTLRPPNIVDAEQVKALIASLRAASPRPLMVGVDEEGGRVSRLRDIIGPSDSARELGTTSAAEITETAASRGSAIRALGFDVDFAPVVDADGGPSDGVIGDRSFSAVPGEAGALATAFAQGLWTAGLRSVAKHFPGQGGLPEDSHQGTVVSDAPLSTVRESADGFRPLIEAGTAAVMMSHATFSALGPLPASLEPAAYELLRSLGFDGVAITDSVGMGAIVQTWPYAESAALALAAGADMVFANQGDQARAMRDGIVASIKAGRLSEARLDEAVGRVLTMRGEDPAAMVCTPD